MFKDVLKQLRESRGLTQEELASSLGVTAGTIGNYEQGQRLPKDDIMWMSIAQYFGVSVDYLMDAGQNVLFPQFSLDAQCTLNYDGSNQLKQELIVLMQDILDNVSNETKLQQIKMFLETYKK